MKSYFSKRSFLITASITVLISLGFILNTQNSGQNPKRVVIESVLNAPIDHSLALFSQDIQSLKERLADSGIDIGNAQNIKQIAQSNKTSPFKIVDILSR